MKGIVMSKRQLVINGFDVKTIERLAHSEDFHKVGYVTEGGHYRFFVDELKEYLKEETKYKC